VIACIICHCTEARSCAQTEHERCTWSARAEPVCSRCATNIDHLLDHVEVAPCTPAQLLAPLYGFTRAEAQRIVDYLLKLGELALDGGVLHVDRPAPPLQHLGSIDGVEVWSPGTFVAGQGWGPLQGPLAAAVTSIVVPFNPSPKEST
jgi:hypothetical protein